MPFINASLVIGYLRSFKMATIDGRYGAGKTSLSFRLAYELLKNHGYKYLISNLPSPWRDDKQNIVPDKSGALNSVIILDEAGLFLDNPAAAKRFQGALRKLNCVVIMPSVTPVSSRVKYVTINREFNAARIGINAWVYRAVVNNDRRNSDFFIWVNPSEIYGLYGTNHYPTDDRGIAQYLQDAVTRHKETYADVSNYSDLDNTLSGQNQDDQGDATILEAAEIIQQSIGSFNIEYSRRKR